METEQKIDRFSLSAIWLGKGIVRVVRKKFGIENRLISTLRASNAAAILLLVSACSTAELAIDLAKKQKIKEKAETETPEVVAQPHYKVGNPYQIAGIWYYPDRDLTYDKTGIASWYGCLLYTSPSPRDS